MRTSPEKKKGPRLPRAGNLETFLLDQKAGTDFGKGAARHTTLPDDTRRAQPNREVQPSGLAESLVSAIRGRKNPACTQSTGG